MEYKKVLEMRKSNKDYTGKVYSENIIDSIVEDVMLTPSSCGSEPWEILIIRNENKGKELIKKLYPLLKSQKNILSSSHLMFVFYRNESNFINGSEFMNKYEEKYDKIGVDGKHMSEMILNYLKEDVSSVNSWSRRQTNILLTNILNSAAAHGLGSNPMEGMYYDQVESLLEKQNLFNKNLFNLSYVVSLGESNGSVYDRVRLDSAYNVKKYGN